MSDIVTVFTAILGWFSSVFNGMDSITVISEAGVTLTLLDVFVAFDIVTITIWFVKRVMDSPKSDN